MFEELTLPPGVYVEEETDHYGRFSIAPLDRGFGHTLGNSLRRILLGATSGAAIVTLRIKGVLHEFSAIPGVYEEVPIIVLNLKRVRLKMGPDAPDFPLLTLAVSQQGEVTAAQIETPAGVEIVNKDEYLFSVTGRLEDEIYMEMNVIRGRGFVPAEDFPDEFKAEQPPNTIFLDAIFSPVKRATYRVEKVRVGAAVDKEKLVLEVWTDGTRGPYDVFQEAVDIYNRLGEKLGVRLKERPIPTPEERRIKFEEMERIKSLVTKYIDNLGVSKRTLQTLKEAGLVLIADVVSRTEKDLLKIRNFGEKSLEEVKEAVEKLGLKFGLDLSDMEEELELRRKEYLEEQEEFGE